MANNSFSYTHLTFGCASQKDSYSAHNDTNAFYFMLFFRKILISVSSFFFAFLLFFPQKDFDIFHALLFEAFLCSFDNSYLSFLCIKKIIKNIFISFLYAYNLILKYELHKLYIWVTKIIWVV